MDLKERVSQWITVLKKRGYNQNYIASNWDVRPQYISSMKKMKESVGFDVVKRILELDTELNPRWLILGIGEMYEDNLTDYDRNRYESIHELKQNTSRIEVNEKTPAYQRKHTIEELIKKNIELIEKLNEYIHEDKIETRQKRQDVND